MTSATVVQEMVTYPLLDLTMFHAIVYVVDENQGTLSLGLHDVVIMKKTGCTLWKLSRPRQVTPF